MNVKIFDHAGAEEYVSWEKGQYCNLSFTNEMPGGMISASFDVPVEYSLPYKWADVYNRVKIYEDVDLVWAGYIFGLGREWGSGSNINVGCVGEVGHLATQPANVRLSNEKGSTYITDHILVGALMYYLETGEVDTTDYTIPGALDFKPYKTKREVVDELYKYNEDTHDWYVWDNNFYWVPKEETIAYETSTEFSEGSLRQDLSEFANAVYYSYRDADGVIQTSNASDSDTAYPSTVKLEQYSDNMSSAQASQRASASLEEHKVLGTVADITVKKVWNVDGGEIPISKVKPGKIIRILGVVNAKASPAEAFTLNDIDVFRIASVTYEQSDTDEVIRLTPGRLPQNIVRALAR